MPLRSESVTIYTCDNCGTEVELEGVNGLSAPFPTGWLNVGGYGPSADMFCSWACIGEYGTARGEEVAARAEARAAAMRGES